MTTLRKKTMEELNSQQCEVLQDVVSRIDLMTHDEMQELVWRLTYQPKKAAQELGFSENISEKDCKTIRAELANQYRDNHPNWAYGKAKIVDHETTELWKELGGDQYAYHTVMEKLQEFSYFTDDRIFKANRCLNSKREQSRYGGLRELGFSYDESDFLLPVASQIGQIFAKMMAETLKKYQEEEPFKKKDEKHPQDKKKTDDSEDDLPFTFGEEEEKKMGIDPVKLLSQRKEIETFYETLDKVMSNPQYDWLVENREKVEALFKLCGELNG